MFALPLNKAELRNPCEEPNPPGDGAPDDPRPRERGERNRARALPAGVAGARPRLTAPEEGLCIVALLLDVKLIRLQAHGHQSLALSVERWDYPQILNKEETTCRDAFMNLLLPMMIRTLLLALLLCARSGVSTLSLSPNATHLFLDDDGIASSFNVSFAVGTLRKEFATPAVVPEHAWEKGLHFYTSAITVPDGVVVGVSAHFRLYYACFADTENSPMYVCLAVSSDGVSWTKPMSPAFPFNGSSTNRVFCVNASSPGSWPGSVLLDMAAQASERFKLTYEGAGGNRFLYLATSSDGLSWSRRDPEVPIIPVRLFSDTQTAIVMDPSSGRYLAFGRKDSDIGQNASVGCEGNYPSLRRVLLATSTTGAAGPYSDPVEILTPGLPDAYSCLDIYNPAPIVVPGALLLLPSSFLHYGVSSAIPPFPPNASGFNDGVLDVRLVVSRDWENFTFVSRDSFLPRGTGYRDPDLGCFSALDSDADAGFVFATAGGLVDTAALRDPADAFVPTPPFAYAVPSARISLLYFGTQRTHGGSIAHGLQGILRATLRREGWVSARSPASDPVGAAAFLSEPLVVPDRATVCGAPTAQLWLLLNVRTSVAGRVSVTLLAPDLTPIPGFNVAVPFTGDAIRAPVGWSSAGANVTSYDFSALAGSSVIVRVELVHAELFAWEVQCVQA